MKLAIAIMLAVVQPELVQFGDEAVVMKKTDVVPSQCGSIFDDLETEKRQVKVEELWQRALNECGNPDALVALAQFTPDPVEAYAYLFVYAEHKKYNLRVARHPVTEDMDRHARKLLVEAGQALTPEQKKVAVKRAAQIRKGAANDLWVFVAEE